MKKRKKKTKISCTLIATIIICLVVFILFIINKYCKNSTIKSMVEIAILILFIAGMVFGICLLIKTIVDMLRTLLDDYQTKNNLFSGALSIFFVLILLAVIIETIGIHFNKGNYKLYHSIADAFINTIPGWFTVIGVIYTATIQEKRRSEDFVISNTPYPLIEFAVKKDLKKSKKKAVSIKVSNLADNMLIPISIGGKELEYKPVTKSTFREFENLEFPFFENCDEIFFVYEDANSRRYITKLHINNAIIKQPPEDYIIIKNEKPILDEKEVSVISSH